MWCLAVLLHQVLDVVLERVQIGFQSECVCEGQWDRAVEIESGEQFHVAYTSRVSAQHPFHPVRRLLRTLRRKQQQRSETEC